MLDTQQEHMSLASSSIELQISRLEDDRAVAMAEHARAIASANGEAMAAARSLTERITWRRAELLPARMHARLTTAARAREVATADLADKQQAAQAAQHEVSDHKERLAALNPLDSAARTDAMQRITRSEAVALAADDDLMAARRRYAATHGWAHDLDQAARRLDIAGQSVMTGAAVLERRAAVEREEHRVASSLRSAATLVHVTEAHQDACLEGLRLAERLSSAMKDKLVDQRRKIAGLNVLSPERHRLEGDLPSLLGVIDDEDLAVGVAERRYASASRQLSDAKHDQAILVARVADKLPLWVRTVDKLIDDGTALETAVDAADHATA